MKGSKVSDEEIEKIYPLHNDQINWKELTDKFFRECTEEYGHAGNKKIKIDLAPHDLLAWFKKQIKYQQEQGSKVSDEEVLRKDYLKLMLDWHEEYLREGKFKIPLDHEQSEYLSWLAFRLEREFNNKKA